MDKENIDYATYFKNARKELGLNQDDFAKLLGLDSGKTGICNIEKGRYEPSQNTIKCLEYLLKLNKNSQSYSKNIF